MDLQNSWLVSTTGIGDDTQIVILRPPGPNHHMTPEQALVVAAWLVALADPDGFKFAAVLEAVNNT